MHKIDIHLINHDNKNTSEVRLDYMGWRMQIFPFHSVHFTISLLFILMVEINGAVIRDNMLSLTQTCLAQVYHHRIFL